MESVLTVLSPEFSGASPAGDGETRINQRFLNFVLHIVPQIGANVKFEIVRMTISIVTIFAPKILHCKRGNIVDICNVSC